MHKKILCLVSTLALTFSMSCPVFASPNTNQNALNKARTDVASLEENVEKLDSKIEGLIQKINNNKKQINNTKTDIKVAEKNIKKAEKDIQKEKGLFDERMKAMYINGNQGYLEIILSSKSLSDFMSNIETVKTIIKYDKKLIATMKNKKAIIVNKKKELSNKEKKLLALKSDNETELAKVSKDKEEQKKLIDKAKKVEILYASRLDASRTIVNKSFQSIQKIRESSPKYIPSRGATGISPNAIVAYASNFMGTRYVWGGETPSGFDCSGFTKYVYAHFGINIPRVAADQACVGQPVSRGNLQPGDLVFFGSDIHHVGIYVGDNCYIHAPHTGDVVKISPLTRSDYSCARRVR